MKLSTSAYQLFSQLPSCDVACVYVLDCTQHQEQPQTDLDMVIREVSAESLLKITQGGAYDFAARDAEQLATVANCLAAFVEDQLVGYLWYRGGDIPAEMNTPGAPFRGFDLELSDTTQYLFKVFVHKHYRGHRVNQTLCKELAHRLAVQGYEKLVTLTAWDNAAFRKSAEHMGFRNMSQCVEWTTHKKSIYYFPKEDNLFVRFANPAKNPDTKLKWPTIA